MANARSESEEILDPKLEEQLRREFFGTTVSENVSESHQPQTNTNSNLNTGMLVIGASMIGLVGMQFPFLFIKHAPFMATPAHKIRDALKFINKTRTSSTRSFPASPKQKKKPPSSRTFVDLGSGDGQAVYEAAKLGYKAVGIEFNWTLWAFASLRRQFFWPTEVKRRSQFLLQDFSNYNLQDANTIMIFAVPRTMPILGRKIQSECSHGTTIMSYRFEMPLAGDEESNSKRNRPNGNKKLAEKENSDQAANGDYDDRAMEAEDLRLRAKCIYDREEMRIYRMGE